MSAFATPSNGVINGKCWYGLNIPTSVCFTFDAGGTTAGGNLTLATNNGTLTTLADKGSYEIRTFGSVKVLVITKVPASLTRMYNNANGLSIYSEKDGFAVGGTLRVAGIADSQDNQNKQFNKTAFAAIMSKLSLPALP